MMIVKPMVVALLLWTCAVVAGTPAADNRVDRMADALVQILPMGAIFDDFAAKDPAWPMQDKPGAVTDEQLACVRQELSTAGFRRSRLAEAAAYAKANPSRMDEDVKLLESGAAELFGKLIRAGASQTAGDQAVTPESIVAAATSDQMLSFVTFVSDPNHAGLRKLSGFGDALSITKSGSENEKSGYQLGASLAAQLMIKAMGTCKVPPSAYM